MLIWTRKLNMADGGSSGGVSTVAALYVQTGGAYFGLPNVDPWDEVRDARQYPGPHPVVAHPPCQRWGKFWAGQPLWIKRTGQRKKKGDDGGCFAAALASVRRWGGVLEHPWQSHAWAHFGLTVPPRGGGWVKADSFGGWTCCVEQGRYGHYARKPTMLYAVGTDLPELEWGETEIQLDPAVVARMGLKRAKRLGEVGARGGGRDSTPRIHTPGPFRKVLIAMARSVRREACSLANNVDLDEKNISTKQSKAFTLTSTRNEADMFQISITAANPTELAEAIRALSPIAFGTELPALPQAKAPLVIDADAKAPLAVDDAQDAEPAEPKQRRTRAKKTDTPAPAETASAAENVDSDEKSDESQTDIEDAIAAGKAADETAKPADKATEKADAAPLTMTREELKSWIIREYLVACVPTQDERPPAFKALCEENGFKNFTETPDDKLASLKALADEKIKQFKSGGK